MLELVSDDTDRGEIEVESFDLRGTTTSGRAVVSSRVGNGGGLKVLDVGTDNVSE
jgi:hypothetical protein